MLTNTHTYAQSDTMLLQSLLDLKVMTFPHAHIHKCSSHMITLSLISQRETLMEFDREPYIQR